MFYAKAKPAIRWW